SRTMTFLRSNLHHAQGRYHIIRRKTVDTRQSGLNGGENTHPGTKTEQTGFADPRKLYITTLERVFQQPVRFN
ncbi:MAG: hypothetical protein ACO33A_14490, partial [Hyphomonas sp.]